VLNLTAAVVWTYCDGHHDTGAIAEAIARELDGTRADTIQDDIAIVLQRFAREGLLQ
jgi:hypothetical protein